MKENGLMEIKMVKENKQINLISDTMDNGRMERKTDLEKLDYQMEIFMKVNSLKG